MKMADEKGKDIERKPFYEHFEVDAGEYGKLTCSYDPTGVVDTFTKYFVQYFGAESSEGRPDVLMHANCASVEFIYMLEESLKKALESNFNMSVEFAKLLYDNSNLAHSIIGNIGYPATGVILIGEDKTETLFNFPKVRASESVARIVRPFRRAIKERFKVARGKTIGTKKPEDIRQIEKVEFEAQIRRAIKNIFSEGLRKDRGIKTAVAKLLGIGGVNPVTGNDSSLQAFIAIRN
jgi:hypothetical protein